MKKFVFIIVVILVFFGMSACKTKKVISENININTSQEISETGTIINATKINKQIVYANPGDIINIALHEKAESLNQWSLKAPIMSGDISLKDHKIIKENDLRLKNGEFISEWSLKILKTNNFEILFYYEDPLKPNIPLDSFRIFIITDKKRGNGSFIHIIEPVSEQKVDNQFLIRGYVNFKNKNLFYKLSEFDKKNLISASQIILENDVSYFEFPINIKKMNIRRGILKIYQQSSDGLEENAIEIPINFNKK